MRIFQCIWILIFTISCRTSYYNQEAKAERIFITDSITNDNEITKMIQPYKIKLDKEMDRVLAYNPYELNKKGYNHSLGNFVTDLMLEETNILYQKLYPNEKIDAVLMNSGGLRRTFTPGTLTVRSMFELMPFENEIVVVTMTADKFKEMVEFLNEGDRAHPIAGFMFVKNEDRPSNIIIGRKPWNPNATYNVVTNDYLFKGGDDMTFFQKPIKSTFLDIKLRDMFIQYLEKVDTIRVDNMPRYIVK